jgi:hypothetical protein
VTRAIDAEALLPLIRRLTRAPTGGGRITCAVDLPVPSYAADEFRQKEQFAVFFLTAF